MNKYITIITLTVILVSCCNTKSSEKDITNKNDLDVLKIWNNHLKAYGITDSILNIKSASGTSISIIGNDTIKTKLIVICPDKVYQEINYQNGSSLHYIINGDKGIGVFEGEQVNLNKQQIESFHHIGLVFPEFYFEEMGCTFKLLGDSIIRGNNSHIIEVFDHDKSLGKYYIDKQTYNIHRHVSNGSIYDIHKTKTVNGIREIFESTTIMGKDTMYTKRIDSKYNVKVDESLFSF